MTIAHNIIRSVVTRIEALNEEIKDRNEAKSEIFAEAKGHGMNVAALKALIGRRAKDPDKLSQLEADIEAYQAVLGTEPATRAHLHEAAE